MSFTGAHISRPGFIVDVNKENVYLPEQREAKHVQGNQDVWIRATLETFWITARVIRNDSTGEVISQLQSMNNTRYRYNASHLNKYSEFSEWPCFL